MMNFQIQAVLLCLPFCISQFIELKRMEEDIFPPRPYAFGYEVRDKYGDQWRAEESDGLGSVHGSYGFVDDDGRHRAVEYVADGDGFRARVKTNEPGMNVPSPADVQIVHEDGEVDYADIDYANFHVFGLEKLRVPSHSKEFFTDVSSRGNALQDVSSRGNALQDVSSRGNALQNIPSGSKRVLFKHQEFSEKVPPIYEVDGHLQSPWFPMHTVAQI
ncbi:hypothetical protein JTE90_011492 [Oedothorax gibbosus]|uniref:Cuticle protein n=1 Tax=Oedothorax gibbosus TaxID=931172 RepID=A0AAV6VBS4_9ARAC|nr:hypothetical protein JTE90_011492 [Oedothorax gibbosus]